MLTSLTIGEYIHIFIVGMAIIMALSLLIQEKKAKTPPAPTFPWIRAYVMKLMAEYIPVDVEVKIADLGCGGGGMARAMARHFKKAEIHGYELMTFPALMAKILGVMTSRRIKIHNGNMLDADLTQFNAMYCYLPTFILEDLLPQFKTLKAGTIIITSGWAIPDFTPIRVEQKHVFGIKMPIHVYKVT